MDRETSNITVGAHSFEVKTYATAREAHAIQSAYFRGAKVEMVGQEAKISEFNPAIQFDVQLEMIKQLVISMDGKPENIVERCENLPSSDFDELVATLDEIASKKKK